MSEEFDSFEGMDDLSFEQKQVLEDLIVDTALGIHSCLLQVEVVLRRC